MMAVHVRIDDEIDRASRELLHRLHQAGRDRRHTIVDEQHMLIADEQSDVGAETVCSFEHVDTGHDLGGFYRRRQSIGGDRRMSKTPDLRSEYL